MTTTRTGAPLGPQHKAAIAVLALDESVAAQLLSHLGDAEMRALAKAVEELDVVPSETLAAVLGELARAMSGPVSVSRTGGRAYVERLAALSLGEPRASRLFGPTEAPPVPAIELVKSARTKTLAELLGDEHPQIAAIIMCQLPTRTAAAVLKAMPEDRSADLAKRMAAIEEIPDAAVLEASESLARALAAAGGLSNSDHRSEFDGLAFVAALVNELPVDHGDALLAKVGEVDPAVAARVREAMFTFEDLLRIEQRQLGPLLRAVQSEQVVIALQTASEELRSHFFGALSQRAAQTLREDLANNKPRRIAEVEAAQRQIVETATRLAAEGTLQLPPRGEA